MKKFLSLFFAAFMLSTAALATPADRLKLATGVNNFYVNPCAAQTGWSAGDNANDGLSQTTPKKNYQAMAQYIADNYDFAGNLAQINGAPSCTDTQGMHFAPHALVGAQGGAALRIVGGTGSAIIPTSGTAVDVFNGAILQLKNIKLSSPNGAAAGASFGAQLYLLDGVELGAAANRIVVGSSGHVLLSGAVTVSGDAFSTVMVSSGGIFDGVGSFTFLSNATHAGAFAYIVLNGVAHFGPITINTGGYTITGSRWTAGFNGMIMSATGNCNTYFPGSVNGGAITGGQCI